MNNEVEQLQKNIYVLASTFTNEMRKLFRQYTIDLPDDIKEKLMLVFC